MSRFFSRLNQFFPRTLAILRALIILAMPAIATYVRSSWGNSGGAVEADEVRNLRALLAEGPDRSVTADDVERMQIATPFCLYEPVARINMYISLKF